MRIRMQELLKIKPVESCRWDLLSLGEVMLRFDPGEGRIHTARQFQVWEGGGEYNVARALRRCFGLRAAVATAFADNPVGRLAEDLILQGGVDTSLVRWVPYDGVGRTVRNGLNFVERGFGARRSLGCSDRGHTAVSQLKPADFDWDAIFGEGNGVRWLHTGGVFAALSATTPAVAAAAMDAARAHGTVVSYDVNYRESLWQGAGGSAKARAVNRALIAKADVLFGDCSALVELEPQAAADAPKDSDGPLPRAYAAAIEQVRREFPQLKMIASPLRKAASDWGGVAATGAGMITERFTPIEILDRVGGGDAFASGAIFGLLRGHDVRWALRCGVAHGALAMTTPGDASMATLAEVEHRMDGGSAHIVR